MFFPDSCGYTVYEIPVTNCLSNLISYFNLLSLVGIYVSSLKPPLPTSVFNTVMYTFLDYICRDSPALISFTSKLCVYLSERYYRVASPCFRRAQCW